MVVIVSSIVINANIFAWLRHVVVIKVRISSPCNGSHPPSSPPQQGRSGEWTCAMPRISQINHTAFWVPQGSRVSLLNDSDP